MKRPKIFFRHTFKCPECKEIFSRGFDYETLPPIGIACGHCHVMMPSTCEIDVCAMEPESGDFEILCMSIFMASFIHSQTAEIFALDDMADSAIKSFRVLQKQRRQELET